MGNIQYELFQLLLVYILNFHQSNLKGLLAGNVVSVVRKNITFVHFM